jgi:hypothetical protein
VELTKLTRIIYYTFRRFLIISMIVLEDAEGIQVLTSH